VQMGLELDMVGPLTWRAIARLEQADRLASLLDLLEGAPAGSAVEAVWARVATPAAVRRVLEGAPIDFRSLDRLLGRVGLEAADLLLDFLATAEERAVRRALLDRLVTLGAVLGPRLAARLGDERWYVVRNLLWMLDRLPALPPDFSPGPFSAHADARVRREALKLRLKVLAERDDRGPAGLSAERAAARRRPRAGPRATRRAARAGHPRVGQESRRGGARRAAAPV